MDQRNTSHSGDINTPQVPTTLLPDIMARLQRRQPYLSSALNQEELRAGLHHTDWDIRAAAIKALGEEKSLADLTPLHNALKDEHRLVRAAAIRALGKLGTRVPLETLLIAMRDPAAEVREMVIFVLSELSEQNPDLLKALLLASRQDTHSHVREAATYALERYNNQKPSTHITAEVLSFDMPTQSTTWQSTIKRYMSIFSRQIRILHKSIWVCSPLLLLLWSLRYILPNSADTLRDVSQAGLYLALFMTVMAAAGTAFIYGGEHDIGFELTLATPTSPRIIMLFRFLLVVGYNLLLTVGASAALALTHGNDIWQTIHIWLGPMLLFSSLTLTISLLIGSWVAMSVMLVLTASQSLVFHLQDSFPRVDFSFSPTWQTQPTLLGITILLLLLALYLAPRQTRLHFQS